MRKNRKKCHPRIRKRQQYKRNKHGKFGNQKFGGEASPKLVSERTIEGYAVVVGQESKYMYDPVLRKCFIEIIEVGAVDEELIKRSDIRALLEHNRERLLARSGMGSGSLRLHLDNYGLGYALDAPDTPDGKFAVEMVKRGDLFGSSFGYRTDERKNVEWIKRSDGILLRKVHKIDMISEISIVASPAYIGTQVNVRSIEDTFEHPDESYKKEIEELRKLSKFLIMKKEIRRNRARIAEINARLGEMADLLDTNKRSLTPDEITEKEALVQEKEILQLRTARMVNDEERVSEQEMRSEVAFAGAVASFVHNRSLPEGCDGIMNGNSIDIPLTRAATIQDTTTVAPLIPMTIGEIIQPLEKGLILGKVGCKMQYGLVGDWVLPVVCRH